MTDPTNISARNSAGVSAAAAVALQLDARPANVLLVRQAVEGAAREFGAGDALLDDIKLAVSEACSNVVKYAYEGDPGPLRVEMSAEDTKLRVTVRDFGKWLQPTEPPAEEPSGMGIPLIESVTLSHLIQQHADGTEVLMVFGLNGDRDA
jgi:anti-sigma regulatory factor (Ser/Thr protein kinase)